MKKKNLRLNKSYVSNTIKPPYYGEKIAASEYIDRYKYCDYNEEISKKFYKFLDLGINLPFEISEENNNVLILTLSISSTSNAVPANSSFYVQSSSYDDYVSILITKENFKILRNHMDICGYKDPYIYELFSGKIKNMYENRSAIKFHQTINDILDLIPSVGREYKIDEILND